MHLYIYLDIDEALVQHLMKEMSGQITVIQGILHHLAYLYEEIQYDRCFFGGHLLKMQFHG